MSIYLKLIDIIRDMMSSMLEQPRSLILRLIGIVDGSNYQRCSKQIKARITPTSKSNPSVIGSG